ncbi:lipopolysaccharide kinase InaA family protein [Salegentibacter sp. F188]|uniref:Lipopolysaccharide kinase InaA family protein n=1 Tax=Autumnicola patrickiae TaxID=3075591 RepID=A0ABU3DXM0_9FLAO|nr:lipopolysaccharide kinase InaA family protein [Salegentibacter sp. F188]MDT0688475.1 lipopolysaccharide kinase InaA family protein [Salegentibacter sp. F188]
MKLIVNEDYSPKKKELIGIINNLKNRGRDISTGKRNVLKVIDFEGQEINIKAFQIPNLINRVAYRFFRKSKAERSYNYARELINRGINTPAPIAYAEETTSLSLEKSYYISEHLDYDLTFRDLDLRKSGHEEILRAFTRFTFELHEKNIQFLDHSPGNTLIKISAEGYKFYLVDLNRMNFKSLNFSERMQNFKRLSRDKAIYEIMAEEYARLAKQPSLLIFEKMWHFNQSFFAKRQKKRNFKNKLLKKS